MGDGSFGRETIEFLDPDSGEDDDHGDRVAWIDGDEVGAGANRNDGRLPPRTTPNRVAATLLALALFLGCLGTSGAAAYSRHMTDRRIASTLQLQSGPGAPSIPGLTQLAFAPVWRAQVSEQVSFPVLNRSPKPVTLLSATLSEPGLVSNSPLAPVGNRLLAPGQSGTVGGTVTVDCTNAAGIGAVVVFEGGTTRGEFVPPSLSVVARTSGGTTGVARLNPEASSQLDLQQRICTQQGSTPIALNEIVAAVNPDTHTITLDLSAGSLPTETMRYSASATYSGSPAQHIRGLALSRPVAESPTAGVLTYGDRLSLEYVIEVTSCPAAPLPRTDRVEIRLDASIKSFHLQGVVQSTDLDSLIGQACGSR